MEDLGKKNENLFGAQNLKEDDVANPCGLIAKNVFNDTFALVDYDGISIEIEQDDIAWEVDREDYFSHLDDDWTDK